MASFASNEHIEPLFDIDETTPQGVINYNEKRDRIKALIDDGTNVDQNASNIMLASETKIVANVNNFSVITKLWIYTIAELQKVNPSLAQGMLNIVLFAGTLTVGKKSLEISKIILTETVKLLLNTDIKKLLLNGTTLTKYGFIVTSLVTSILFWSGYSIRDANNLLSTYISGTITDDQVNEILLKKETPVIDKISLAQSLAHLNTCLLYLKKIVCKENLIVFAKSIMDKTRSFFDNLCAAGTSGLTLIEELKTSSRVLLDEDIDSYGTSSKRKYSDDDSINSSEASETTIDSTATKLTENIDIDNSTDPQLLDNLIEVNESAELSVENSKRSKYNENSQGSISSNLTASQGDFSSQDSQLGGSKRKTSKKSSNHAKHAKKTSKHSKKSKKHHRKISKRTKKH